MIATTPILWGAPPWIFPQSQTACSAIGGIIVCGAPKIVHSGIRRLTDRQPQVQPCWNPRLYMLVAGTPLVSTSVLHRLTQRNKSASGSETWLTNKCNGLSCASFSLYPSTRTFAWCHSPNAGSPSKSKLHPHRRETDQHNLLADGKCAGISFAVSLTYSNSIKLIFLIFMLIRQDFDHDLKMPNRLTRREQHTSL
jgi:hypothetical protein